jgi:hypothetical protein
MEDYEQLFSSIEPWANIISIYTYQKEYAIYLTFKYDLKIIKGMSKLQCQGNFVIHDDNIKGTPFTIKAEPFGDLLISNNGAVLLVDKLRFFSSKKLEIGIGVTGLWVKDQTYLDDNAKKMIIYEWIRLSGLELLNKGLFIERNRDNYLITEDEVEEIYMLWDRIY